MILDYWYEMHNFCMIVSFIGIKGEALKGSFVTLFVDVNVWSWPDIEQHTQLRNLSREFAQLCVYDMNDMTCTMHAVGYSFFLKPTMTQAVCVFV